MSQLILGVGELGATGTAGAAVKTFALGSCVAVLLLDPATHVVGMAHVALPDSSINPAKVRERPGYFADTAIPLLFQEMGHCGARVGRGTLVKIAGGASVMCRNDIFSIGERNIEAVKKILAANNLAVIAEDVGGTISRTVAVHVDTGRVQLSSPGRPDWYI